MAWSLLGLASWSQTSGDRDILCQFSKGVSFCVEKSLSPIGLWLEDHFAFFYSIQADFFFFFFVSGPWAFWKACNFHFFFPPSGA